MAATNSLRSDPTSAVLTRLHDAARGDRIRFLKLVPRLAVGFAQRKSFSESVPPEATKDLYIPVSREQGEFLYLTARVIGARNVVEFGTSFGISTIYLAAALRDNDGSGVVIGSEIDQPKCAQATRNLAEAGLADHADVRGGDALESLRDVPEAVDMVLLDGAKDLYLPVLEMLLPKLRPGAVVLADNIHTFRRGLKPYVDFMQSGEAGFVSTTLSLGQGFEYSTYLG